jgi:lactate/malate dehydrogenase, alpha/beta C-terminal domain
MSDPASVEADVLGEHGTSEVFMWSSVQVAGVRVLDALQQTGRCPEELRRSIEQEVRYANITIIESGTSPGRVGRLGPTRPPASSATATRWARAIEQLRLVMASVQVATVRPQVGLSLFTDFENSTVFKPAAMQEKNVNAMLDHVIAWSGALRPVRDERGEKR